MKDVDIVSIKGLTKSLWAQKVADHLFSEKELADSCVEVSYLLKNNFKNHINLNLLNNDFDNSTQKTPRSNRSALDPERVKLLQEAMKYKYKLDTDKFDKEWILVVKAINSKGRGYKFKHAFQAVQKAFKEFSQRAPASLD